MKKATRNLLRLVANTCLEGEKITKQNKGREKKKKKKKSRFLGAFVLFFFLTCFTFLGNHLRLSDDIFTLRENNNGIYTKTVSVNLFHPKVEHW